MPLAFITDRHTVYTALWNGGSVGIVTPQGEGEGGGGGTERIFRDLLLVRPTVLKGVPAFWEQALSRPISRLISADLARPPYISADLACLLEQVAQASRMVQDRALAILGGRTRVLCCGAGAISDEVPQSFRGCRLHPSSSRSPNREQVAGFFRGCRLGSGEPVQFLELYGGTECGNLACNRRLLAHVQYKLLPLDGGEHHEEGSETGGVGEFVVKTGQMMFSGYHGRPELTADAFTPDGFYRCA